MKVLITFAFLFFHLASASSMADDDIGLSRNIQFTSNPSGVLVCQKILRKEECLGKTPLNRNFMFNSQASTKKMVFRRFGYQTAEIIIDSSTDRAHVPLKKRDIISSSMSLSSDSQKQVTDEVTSTLLGLIYQADSAADYRFDIAGKVTLTIADKSLLQLSVLVSDKNSHEKLRKANRTRNISAKHNNVLDVFKELRIIDFFTDVAHHTQEHIEEYSFNIVYSQNRAALGFEQVHYYTQYYTGSYYTRQAGEYIRVDKFDVLKHAKDETVVRPEGVSELIEYNFTFSASTVSQNQPLNAVFHKVDISSNNNRKLKYEAVSLEEEG
jgi:hypothetical protein